jgi:DUF2934 family protein
MKSQTVKQPRKQTPPPSPTNQKEQTASLSKLSPQARPSFDDLHARITARAYDLYVERGYRDGCGLEDWLDAEQEILKRAFPA